MWTIEYASAHLVLRHQGTLPVILTCPHDGDTAPPGVPERTGQPPAPDCHFSKRADLNTRLVTMRVAQRVLELCGEAPYVVMAAFHRKFIDANRTRDCAFEVPAAATSYDEYHNTVRSFVDEVRAENGELGLLFDIHGTAGVASDPADLYLGTANGDTVARLLGVDEGALWRPRGLRGLLKAAGYVVSPKQRGVPETPELDGGHTVRTYGSACPDGLDAFQVEIAAPLRTEAAKRDRFIDVFAHAIVSAVDRYAAVHTMAVIQSLDAPSGARGESTQLVAGRLDRH